jgi:hypothetical protein
MSYDQPSAAPGRSCGTCSLCCKIMRIDALDKPVGKWCPHVVKGQGCSIYSSRPKECQEFYCLWLLDGALGDEWLPAKSKMVLAPDGNRITAHVDGGWPSAWRSEPYYSQLKQWAWNAVEHGGQVCVSVNGLITVILPTKDVELGKCEPGDNIVVAETKSGWEAYKMALNDVRPEDRGKWIHISKGKRTEI